MILRYINFLYLSIYLSIIVRSVALCNVLFHASPGRPMQKVEVKKNFASGASEIVRGFQYSTSPWPLCPIGRRVENASTRLRSDTNVLLPPPATATGSTTTCVVRDITANQVAALNSRLDYGNALLARLPYTTIAWSIAPLQRVINAAVRLVYGLRLRERDHVSAAMELHWLPIEDRIQYKIYFTGPSLYQRQSSIIHFNTASFHIYSAHSPEICVKPKPAAGPRLHGTVCQGHCVNPRHSQSSKDN